MIEAECVMNKTALILQPNYLSDIDSWHGHIPFAFDLIKHIKPKVFVELGTHKGDSYLAFCQAVKSFQTNTKCFAVDTWQGEEHAGHYDESIYHDLRNYHDDFYSDFSTLLKITFDEALSEFDDSSVDLLHIDGLHTYGAVAHDFETWLPKMSSTGVVLFHDICVRDRGFGVWKLWDDIKLKFPSFEFYHSHGLGILAVGADIPSWIESLSQLESEQRLSTQKEYEVLGRSVWSYSLHRKYKKLSTEHTHAQEVVAERDAQLSDLTRQLESLGEEHEHAQSIVAERDAQLSDLTRHLESLGEEHEHAQSIVAERDAQLSDLTRHLESLGEEHEHAQSIVAERDAQLANIYSHMNKSWLGKWFMRRMDKNETTN